MSDEITPELWVITVTPLGIFCGNCALELVAPIPVHTSLKTLMGYVNNHIKDCPTLAGRDVQIEQEPQEAGSWVVYDFDYHAYPIGLHKTEIEARRHHGSLGYGHVKFWPYGKDWTDLINGKE